MIEEQLEIIKDYIKSTDDEIKTLQEKSNILKESLS